MQAHEPKRSAQQTAHHKERQAARRPGGQIGEPAGTSRDARARAGDEDHSEDRHARILSGALDDCQR